jgi:hypothetical protein
MASRISKACAAALVLVATVFVLVEPAAAAGGTLIDPGPVYDEIDTDVVFDWAPDPHTGEPRKLEIVGGTENFPCAHGDDPDDGEIGTPDPPNQSAPSGGCFTVQVDLNNINNGLVNFTGASGGGLPGGAEVLNATPLPAAHFNIFGTREEVNAALRTLTFEPASGYETSYPPASGDPTFITLTIYDGAQDKIAFVDGDGDVIDPDQITLDVRLEQPNDPPDLTIGVQNQPVEVPAGGEAVLSNDDGNGVDEFADDTFIEDPDIDDDEDDDFILMVAWLDGGNGLADFSLSPSVSPECVTILDEIIAQDDATDLGEPLEHHCDVLPGPITASLVPADIPGSISFGTDTQDEQAIALLGRIEEADNVDGTAEGILQYIEFDAPPSGDCDCTITVVVSDLGNNGLPLPNVVPGVVLPFPGFDLETIDFKVRDAQNDPPVVTPVPAGATPVDELASVPVSFTVTDSDADDRDLTITSIATSGGTLSGAPTVPFNGSATALTSALTAMSFTASETVADPGLGSVTVTVQDNGNGPAPDPGDNQSGSGTATFTIDEDGNPDADPNPGVNDPPALAAPAGITADEGAVVAFDDATNQDGPHPGTLTELNTILDGLTFTPVDDADAVDDSASIFVEVTDNGHNPDSNLPADEGTDSLTIDVQIDDDEIAPPEVNDPPVLSAPAVAAATEGSVFAFDDATIGVDDPDVATDDLTLTITTSGNGTTNQEGVHTDDLGGLNALLDGLTFTPDDDADDLDDSASILIEVNDNGHNPDSNLPADEGTDALTIEVQIDDDDVVAPEVNDPPVLSAPTDISATEGVAFGFDPAVIGVDDPDAGTDDLTMTITPTGGTTNADGATTGTLIELNAILDGLEFTAPQDPDFADEVGSIVIEVNDNGHNPDSNIPAEEGVDTATIDLTIEDDDEPPVEVNDPPVLTTPASIDVTEGLNVALDPASIGVDDPDAGGDDLTVTITSTGEGSTNQEGPHTGTLAELNAILDGLEFQSVDDLDTVDDVASILIEVNDNGHNPDSNVPADEGTDSATIAVTIVEDDAAEPNDPPTLSVPGAQSLLLGGTLAFTGADRIVVDDPDAGSGDLTLHVEATGGTLSPATADVTGTLAELQSFLDSLVFTAGTTVGSGSVTVTVDDQGNTGAGGPLTATATVALTIETVIGENPGATTTTTTSPATTTTAPSVSSGTESTGSITTTTGSLPRTGQSVVLLVSTAAVLVGGGSAVALLARRRRSR